MEHREHLRPKSHLIKHSSEGRQAVHRRTCAHKREKNEGEREGGLLSAGTGVCGQGGVQQLP